MKMYSKPKGTQRRCKLRATHSVKVNHLEETDIPQPGGEETDSKSFSTLLLVDVLCILQRRS